MITSIVSAAEVLERAQEIAMKNKDAVALGNLSEKWLQLGATINEFAENSAESKKEKKSMGFGGN